MTINEAIAHERECNHINEALYDRGYSDGYNKAIDDFVEKISLEISESIIWGMLVNSHKDNSFNDTSDKIVDYVINTANEIAEQLKAGGENGKKKYIELS